MILQVSMLDILNPAIALADKGFPVHPVAADMWKKGEKCLLHNKFGRDMLLEGRAPRAGEIMRMPFLAQTFQVHTEKWKRLVLNFLKKYSSPDLFLLWLVWHFFASFGLGGLRKLIVLVELKETIDNFI